MRMISTNQPFKQHFNQKKKREENHFECSLLFWEENPFQCFLWSNNTYNIRNITYNMQHNHSVQIALRNVFNCNCLRSIAFVQLPSTSIAFNSFIFDVKLQISHSIHTCIAVGFNLFCSVLYFDVIWLCLYFMSSLMS